MDISKAYMFHKACSLSLLLCMVWSFSAAQVPFSPADPGRNAEQGIQRSAIRGILNKFSVSLMSGYGRTTYKHDLSGFSLLQQGGNIYILEGESSNPPLTGYTDWFVDPVKVNGLSVGPNDTFINSDTTAIGFRTTGTNIPVMLTIHYNFSNFRIGGGVAAEFQSMGTIKPRYDNEAINWQQTNYDLGMATRIFGLVGVHLWDFWDYSFVVDAQAGKLNPGGNFNKDLIEYETFFNLGIPIEKNFSEYFRVVLRPAIEFKGYSMKLPESGGVIDFKAPTYYIQAGISMNYPEVPRCPIPSCRTQLKHVHFGKEYRGQPITKKQNPGYGENHPELLMHKGRKNNTPKSELSKKKRSSGNGLINKIKRLFGSGN